MSAEDDVKRIPRTLRDELRRTLILICYEEVYSRPSMTKDVMQNVIFDMYHGKGNNIVSQIDVMLQGHNRYKDLFDVSFVTITDKNLHPSKSNKILTLRNKYYRQHNDKNYIVGQQICREWLARASFQSVELCKKRYLYEQASTTLRYCKKALSFAHKYVDEFGNPLHSGNTIDDIIEKILEDMYRENHKLTAISISLEDDDDEDMSPGTQEKKKIKKSKDDDWSFPGFMAFLLFGPFVPPSDRLSLFTTKDNKALKKSRKEQRADSIKRKSDVRAADGNNKRGWTLDQQIGLAQVQVLNNSSMDNKKQNALNALFMQQRGISEAIERAEHRAKGIDDPNHPFLKRVLTLEDEHDDVRRKIARLADDAYNDSTGKDDNVVLNLLQRYKSPDNTVDTSEDATESTLESTPSKTKTKNSNSLTHMTEITSPMKDTTASQTTLPPADDNKKKLDDEEEDSSDEVKVR